MHLLGILILALLMRQAPPSAIEGIVLRAGTSQPVWNAVVELSGGNKSEPLAVSTSADGRFEFKNLAAGPYRLTVSRNGYLNGAYGQRGPNGDGASLALEAGQTLKDIRLTMIATGAISGRVYDNNGEPLANVTVQALKYSYLDGERRLTMVKGDSTDDRGEYRLFWLPPGMYYISAQPQGEAVRNGFVIMADGGNHTSARIIANTVVLNGTSSPARLGETDAPLYYPGTADAQTAMPVELRPGSDIGGVDFSLARVKTRSVRGIAIDGVTGQPATFASVMLVPRQPSVSGSLRGIPSSAGAFEIQGVLPGSYFLVATTRNNSSGSERLTGGRTPIEVSGSDIDRVAIVLSPALNIQGDVNIEGSNAGDAGSAHPVVTLKNTIPAMPANAQVWALFKDSRQFMLNDVIESEYRVQLEDLPKGAYVKSMRFGASDVLNGNLSIDSRSNDRLEIVLSTNAGTLEGTVLNKNREPLAKAQVTLVPDASHRERADLYRSTTSDDSGRFRLQAIAPGEYSLFAWEDIEESQWRDPEFIRRHEGLGRAIRILEGGGENIEVTAIPFEF